MKKLLTALSACLLSACTNQAATMPLDSGTYLLQNAMNGAEISISFTPAEHTFAGKAAVNRYFGSYKENGNKLKLNPAGSTMMMGPRPLMQAEHDFLQTLDKIVRYDRDGDALTLTTADGKTLVFKRGEEKGD